MTTPTANFGLVLDCTDPQRLADFWSAALDYVNLGAAGAYVALYPRDRPGPKFLFREKGWYLQTELYVRKVLLFYNSRVTDIRRAAPSDLGSQLRVRASTAALY